MLLPQSSFSRNTIQKHLSSCFHWLLVQKIIHLSLVMRYWFILFSSIFHPTRFATIFEHLRRRACLAPATMACPAQLNPPLSNPSSPSASALSSAAWPWRQGEAKAALAPTVAPARPGGGGGGAEPWPADEHGHPHGGRKKMTPAVYDVWCPLASERSFSKATTT